MNKRYYYKEGNREIDIDMGIDIDIDVNILLSL